MSPNNENGSGKNLLMNRDKASRSGSQGHMNTNPNAYQASQGSIFHNLPNNHKVLYEDPARVLNMTEDKWTAIVNKGAEDFVNENKKKHIDKLVENRKILVDQMKQIEDKKM